MTDRIRNEIKEKKKLNRKKRKEKSERKKKLTTRWKEIKELIKALIKEAKGRYEEEMTKKMREKDNRGKDMLKDINRLSGRDVKETDELEVYNGNRRMGDEEAGKMVEKQWKGQFKDRRDLTPIHSGY